MSDIRWSVHEAPPCSQGNRMKEYKSVRIQATQFEVVANGHARDDWHVLGVLSAQYMPAMASHTLSPPAPSGLGWT